MNRELYDKSLSVIMNLSELPQVDPLSLDNNPKYITTVLAIHRATNRVQVLVEAKNNNGLNQFKLDFPTAGVMSGDGTPDDHTDWHMLSFPTEVQNSTSPVEIIQRARRADKIRQQRIQNG